MQSVDSEDPRFVSVVRAHEASYAEQAPFHPDAAYAEAPFPDVSTLANPAYEAVRRAMAVAGWDRGHFGTPSWNPLGRWIKPGNTVLLKPNLVKETHPRDPDGWRYVLTHGSFIRAVADYVAIALRGTGRIWLADAPQTDSSWDAIVRVLQLDSLTAFYKANGLDFELIDLRKEEWRHRDGVVFDRRPRPGDPRGYVAFDLGDNSEFFRHGGAGRYYGADYATAEVNRRHSGGRHQYLVSRSAILADVFINLPKLKTHKKTGITVNLKNLVGINGDKNWLPHHTEGDPTTGGDEVPVMTRLHRLERVGVRVLRQAARHLPGLGPRLMLRAKSAGKLAFGDTETVIRSGNWHGNDTTWRMSLDLNKILLYGNADGTLRHADAAARKPHISFVDGIMAGEGRGPMNPDLVAAGLVATGLDAAAVDLACAVVMGFDPGRLPMVRQAFECKGWPVAATSRDRVELQSDEPAWKGPVDEIEPEACLSFRPHFGWEGVLSR